MWCKKRQPERAAASSSGGSAAWLGCGCSGAAVQGAGSQRPPARRVLVPWIDPRLEIGVGALRRARRWARATAASPPPAARGWHLVGLHRTPASGGLFLNRRGVRKTFSWRFWVAAWPSAGRAAVVSRVLCQAPGRGGTRFGCVPLSHPRCCLSLQAPSLIVRQSWFRHQNALVYVVYERHRLRCFILGGERL